jgi:hypothetical protein
MARSTQPPPHRPTRPPNRLTSSAFTSSVLQRFTGKFVAAVKASADGGGVLGKAPLVWLTLCTGRAAADAIAAAAVAAAEPSSMEQDAPRPPAPGSERRDSAHAHALEHVSSFNSNCRAAGAVKEEQLPGDSGALVPLPPEQLAAQQLETPFAPAAAAPPHQIVDLSDMGPPPAAPAPAAAAALSPQQPPRRGVTLTVPPELVPAEYRRLVLYINNLVDVLEQLPDPVRARFGVGCAVSLCRGRVQVADAWRPGDLFPSLTPHPNSHTSHPNPPNRSPPPRPPGRQEPPRRPRAGAAAPRGRAQLRRRDAREGRRGRVWHHPGAWESLGSADILLLPATTPQPIHTHP